jgi:SOUL heme-binding protein
MWKSISYYGALALESLFGLFGARLYEEPRYDVIGRIADRVEIRRYGPRLAAETQLPVAGEAGNNEAFKLLFAYIAGANQASSSGEGKIAMTVPVEVRNNTLIAMTIPVQTAQQNGGTVMRFYLPAKYSRDRAPEPADARVKIIEAPAETVAVVRFSGSGENFAAHQNKLLEMLGESGWRAIGAPYTLYYDAPFTLPFLRRNEAAVTVIENQ